MAVQEQMHENQQKLTKTIEWKMQLWQDACNLYQTTQISHFFHFCGYYCHLYCEPIEKKNDNLYIVVGLKGYAAPFDLTISSYYSVISVDSCGQEHFSKKGTIQTSNEAIHVIIFQGFSKCLIGHGTTSLFFCFSWYENIGRNITMQENFANVCDCGSQKGNTPSVLKHTETKAENIKLLEHETTEEIQCPSATTICCKNESEHYKFLESLSNDFERLYESKMDTDCVLKVNENRFPVHRYILAARSTVFADIFHHHMSESQNGEVEIQDVSASILNDVLFFMYTGKVRGLSPDTAALMYITANKYALIELRVKCLDFLIHNLTMDNICDTALVAHLHADAVLEDKVVEFIKVWLKELMKSEKWRQFSAAYTLLAQKLLTSAMIALQTDKI